MAFDETVLAGTTGWTIDVLMRDSSAAMPKTGIDPADVQFSYVRAGGSAPSDWYELSSSTWQELSSTYAPGLYRLTVPDAAIASGTNAVTLFLSAADCIPRCLRIGLINANLRDATRLGLSALANADAMATEWDGMVVNGVFTSAALQNSPVGTGGFTTDDRNILNAIHAKTQWITAGVVAISSPLDADMNLQVIAGDSYSVTWSSPDWPDLTGATISLILQSGGQQQTVSATRTGNQVTAVLTPTLSRSLAGQMWVYSLRAVVNQNTQYTLAHGQVVVRSVPLGG